MSLEDWKDTCLEFISPKSVALSPDDVSSSAGELFNTVINDVQLQEEISEILSSARIHNKRKKRSAPVSQALVMTTLVSGSGNQYSEELIVRLKGLLSESSSSNSVVRNVINIPEVQFREFVETCELCDFDIREIVAGINQNTALCNIQLLLQKNWVNFKDMIEMLDETRFDAVCNNIIKSDESSQAAGGQQTCSRNTSSVANRLIAFLKVSHKTKLARICASIVLNPPNEVFYVEDMSISTIQDSLSIFLREPDTFSLEETYAKLVDLHAELLFQRQIVQLSTFLSLLPTELVFNIITPMCHICNVNPRCFLLLWSSLIKREADLAASNSFLSDLFKDSITQQKRHNFVLCLTLTRILDIVGIQSYAESYQIYFGNVSTHITSSKSVEFVLNEFIKLVPFEIGMFLKYHIQLPLRGGTKYKDRLEQYMILAKTRIKDFNIQYIDKNVIHDVEKCISSFKKKRSVPSSIIEASIFKKQYYINHFLPCLLNDKTVSDDQSRQDLVGALYAANKIPKSVVSKSEEVQEITPAENLHSLITSLSTSPHDLKDKIYGLCCCGCDKALLKELIRTVCIDCLHIDSVEFLKDFSNLHHLQDLFRESLKDLIIDTPNSSEFLDLLELFDAETNNQILKVAILQSNLISKSIPVSIEQEFLHLIVLGRLMENINTIIPDIVWKQISVEKLSETLVWWPSPDISKLQQIVIMILDSVVSQQSPNEVCVIIFKSCLTYNIFPLISSSLLTLLPLTSFNKLWVYESLAKVLLPLYQSNIDKPVSIIQHIFKNFFNVINVTKPSLLYRTGSFRSLDNLLSVLDSYKIYITTERYLFTYPVVLTIIRAVQDNKVLFNRICEKSATFLISCVCYIDKIRCFEWVKNNEMIICILDFLKKLQKDGISSNDIPDDKNKCTYFGVCWFQVLLEQPVASFSAVILKSVIVEGYLTAMFYTYAKHWLSGSLKQSHLLCIGDLAIKPAYYHGSYTRPLLMGNDSQNCVITQHFSGYKSSKVFCLLYLGGLAQCYVHGYNMAQHRDEVIVVAKKSYQQAQRLVYDQADTMRSMRGFIMSLTRSTDIAGHHDNASRHHDNASRHHDNMSDAAHTLIQSITQIL